MTTFAFDNSAFSDPAFDAIFEKAVEPETFLSDSQYFSLEHSCRLLTSSFGPRTFIVGSSLLSPDFRDVDLRCILDDVEFDAMFGKNTTRKAFIEKALSEWFTARTYLAIDFQFQRQSYADTFKGARHFIGAPLD